MVFSKFFNKKQKDPESKDNEMDKVNACPKQEKCINHSCRLGRSNQHHNCILFKQFKRGDEHSLMKKI
jgi:hypothetical protein